MLAFSTSVPYHWPFAVPYHWPFALKQLLRICVICNTLHYLLYCPPLTIVIPLSYCTHPPFAKHYIIHIHHWHTIYRPHFLSTIWHCSDIPFTIYNWLLLAYHSLDIMVTSEWYVSGILMVDFKWYVISRPWWIVNRMSNGRPMVGSAQCVNGRPMVYCVNGKPMVDQWCIV